MLASWRNNLIVVVAVVAASLVLTEGCSKDQHVPVDAQPFKAAIAQYLDQQNMAMALKEIKTGPLVQGNTAELDASLAHATMGGPSVTWKFRFERDSKGAWKVVGHR